MKLLNLSKRSKLTLLQLSILLFYIGREKIYTTDMHNEEIQSLIKSIDSRTLPQIKEGIESNLV